MSRIIVCAIILFFSLSCRAQLIDSIRLSFHGTRRPDVSLDSRQSFISSNSAKISGVKLGLTFGKLIKAGVSYNWLSTPYYQARTIFNTGTKSNDVIQEKLYLNYVSLYFQYVFYHSRRWEFDIPLNLGVGTSRFEYTYMDVRYKTNRRWVIMYEPSVAVQYRINRWLGAGFEAGFRLMLKNNKDIKENFNSPLYAFRILVFYGQLYKMAFPTTKLAQQIDNDW